MNQTDVVCECQSVTYKDLEEAIKNGATTFDEVQEITKVGTGCQECLPSVRELIDNMLSNR